jgi:hypothetical protein
MGCSTLHPTKILAVASFALSSRKIITLFTILGLPFLFFFFFFACLLCVVGGGKAEALCCHSSVLMVITKQCA